MNAYDVYWITDPGHAWLAVDVRKYPDAVDYGTGFGYSGEDWIYLEEDCEAPAFLIDHHELDSRSMFVQDYPRTDAIVRFMPKNEDRLDYDAYMARRRAMREATA